MPLVTKRLAQDTKAFWALSRTFNGQDKAPVTVEEALKQLNKIQSSCPHHTRLSLLVDDLLDDVINNSVARKTRTGRFKSRTPSKSNVPRPAQEVV